MVSLLPEPVANDKGHEVKVSNPTNSTKLVWKPKTRAAGVTTQTQNPTLVDQGVVRKFGPDKDCSPEQALQLAEERAVELQAEVYTRGIMQTVGPCNVLGELRIVTDFLANPADTNPVCDNALTAPRSGSVIWGKNVLPLDFSMADFSDLEEKTRQLYQLGENWLLRDEVNPVLFSAPTDLHPRQEQLELQRKTYQPEMSDRITSFAHNVMINEKGPSLSFQESCVLALDHLSKGGTQQEQSRAKSASAAFKSKESDRVGKEKLITVTFDNRAICADYTAQNISVGALHFAAVDMREDLNLTFNMQQASGAENNREYNQCVIKHIDLDMEWWANGRMRKVPSRERVETIASELRAGEFAHAQLRHDQIVTHVTAREHELRASAHDAMCI